MFKTPIQVFEDPPHRSQQLLQGNRAATGLGLVSGRQEVSCIFTEKI
jgi:hypothetical protein